MVRMTRHMHLLPDVSFLRIPVDDVVDTGVLIFPATVVHPTPPIRDVLPTGAEICGGRLRAGAERQHGAQEDQPGRALPGLGARAVQHAATARLHSLPLPGRVLSHYSLTGKLLLWL